MTGQEALVNDGSKHAARPEQVVGESALGASIFERAALQALRPTQTSLAPAP
jgi:hypothetical protein